MCKDIEGLYECCPCKPVCLSWCLRKICCPFTCNGILFQYLLFPILSPIACWPILGWLSALDGCLRCCLYFPLGILFLLGAIIKKAHSMWLAGLVTLREAILLCAGACCMCFIPCSLISALHFDPDGEDTPTVKTVLCRIDGRRFYYLHWWPIMLENLSPIGHPRWAWLGRPLNREFEYETNSFRNTPSWHELDKCLQLESVIHTCESCFDEIVMDPEFPCDYKDPVEHWESKRADTLDRQRDWHHV